MKISNFLLFLFVAAIVLYFIWHYKNDNSDSSHEENYISPEVNKEVNSAHPNRTDSMPNHIHAGKDSDTSIEKLIDSQVDNEMRAVINSRLLTKKKFKKTKNDNGGTILLSDSASSIAIKLLDSDGNTIIVDITKPLPIIKNEN